MSGNAGRFAGDDHSMRRRRGWQRQTQSGGRPAGRGRRDELILFVREAGFEIGLERLAPRADVPGAVGQLRFQQILDAAAIDRVGRAHARGVVQCEQGGTGGVSIAFQRVGLGPTAVGPLGLDEVVRRRAHVGVGRLEAEEAKDEVFGVGGRCFDEPVTSRGDPRCGSLRLFRGGPFPERPDAQVGRREIAGLRRRPHAGRPPVIAACIAADEVLDHLLGIGVGFVAAQFQREESIAGRVRLPALAVALAVLVAIAGEKVGDEIELLGQVPVRNGEAPIPGEGVGEDRLRLTVASEAGPLGDVAFGAFHQ
jgi:hypothetical protein